MAKPNPASRGAMVTALCFVVPVLAIFAALNSYQVSARNAVRFPDTYGVTRAEGRFASVLERLPPSAELGYLTDLEPSNSAYSAAFLAVQYVLAPRQLIVPGKRKTPEWAVGNFSQPRDYAAVAAPFGYVVAEDLGSGVVLFHRNPAQ